MKRIRSVEGGMGGGAYCPNWARPSRTVVSGLV